MARYQLSGQSSSDATSYLATWLTRRHLNENRCPLFRRDNGIVANGTATQYVSPRSPLSASIRVSICVRSFYNGTEWNGTKRNETERKRKRINESTTNTRVEEWLIENLYHPVWYSFISGIRVLSIRITYVHNFARKHASYGQIFFSLSLFLTSIPERNDWNFSGLDFRPSRSSFFRRESSVKCD